MENLDFLPKFYFFSESDAPGLAKQKNLNKKDVNDMLQFTLPIKQFLEFSNHIKTIAELNNLVDKKNTNMVQSEYVFFLIRILSFRII